MPDEHQYTKPHQPARVVSSYAIDDIDGFVVDNLFLMRIDKATMLSYNRDINNQNTAIQPDHQVRFPPASSSRDDWLPNHRVPFK